MVNDLPWGQHSNASIWWLVPLSGEGCSPLVMSAQSEVGGTCNLVAPNKET